MPSGTITLLEASKTMPAGVPRGIIQTYAIAYHPLTVLPLISEPQGIHKWNLESELPYNSGGTRNLNGSWSATRSSTNAFAETVRIYGGKIQIDRAIAKMNPGKIAQERIAQVKAKAYRFTIDMFEGAGGSLLRGIDTIIDNETVFSNQSSDVGTASAGAALTTDHLDKMLSMLNVVPGRTFLYCTPNVHLRAQKLARGNSVSGDTAFAMRFTKDQFGYFSGNYNGVPIIALKDGKGTSLLSTTQGDGSSSYMYGVTYGEENFTGFQVGTPSIYPRTQADVYNYFDFEHIVGTAAKSIMCIARLRYITDSQG